MFGPTLAPFTGLTGVAAPSAEAGINAAATAPAKTIVRRIHGHPTPLRPGATLESMGQPTDIFDLGRLSLSSGEARRIDLRVRADGFQFGGERYEVEDDRVDVLLDATRTAAGFSLRLRFEAQLEGACMRCLEEADHVVEVDAREVDQPGGGEELSSPYLAEGELDLKSWARDALALALPTQIVCGEECQGLCAVCGENLNRAEPGHEHEPEPDPRWAKLRELKLE